MKTTTLRQHTEKEGIFVSKITYIKIYDLITSTRFISFLITITIKNILTIFTTLTVINPFMDN